MAVRQSADVAVSDVDRQMLPLANMYDARRPLCIVARAGPHVLHPWDTCGDEIIDAAVAVRESVQKVHVARVTQSAECRVRFEVLAETSSNGHRFKISSLSVRVQDGVDS